MYTFSFVKIYIFVPSFILNCTFIKKELLLSDIIFDFLRSSLSPTSGTEADVLIHCSDGQIPGI